MEYASIDDTSGVLVSLICIPCFSLAIQSKRVTKLTRRCSNNARQWVGNKPFCRIEGGRVGLGGLEIACADESHFSFGRQIINFLLHHFNRLSVPDLNFNFVCKHKQSFFGAM